MSQIQFNNLMEEALVGAPGTEVVLSHVVLPPRFTLPKHWHPGEEFAYILQGSVTLWQEGAEDLTVHAGDVAKVPHKVVHTVRTGEDGVTLVVFRVHEAGQPERVVVEDTAPAKKVA
jgi:quercetin dioxygenase-like cupin family protein